MPLIKSKTINVISALRAKKNSEGKRVSLASGYGKVWGEVVSSVKTPGTSYGAENGAIIEEMNDNNEVLSIHANGVISLLSKSLRESKTLYRDVVLAEVIKYRDEVKELVEAWSRSVPDDDISVEFLDVPAVLLSNPDLFDLQLALERGPIKARNDTVIPNLALLGDDYYRTVTDDIAPADTDLKLWLAEIGKDTFCAYFDNIFSGMALPKRLEDIEFRINGRLNKSMVAIVSAKALEANTPDGLNISLNELNSKLTNGIMFYSNQLADVVKTLNHHKATGNLIIREDKKERSALVFRPVYDAWLESSGTYESLLGRIISDSSSTTVTAINKNLIEYTDAWKRHNETMIIRKNRDRNRVVKNILRSSYSKALNNPHPAEVQYRGSLASFRMKELDNKVEAMIDRLTDLDLVNLNTTCMKLVTLVRFGHTGAYEYLSSMDAALSVSGDKDIASATRAASINEMARFISDSLQEG